MLRMLALEQHIIYLIIIVLAIGKEISFIFENNEHILK